MPGRTPSQAAIAFRDSLQRSLGCVVDARLNVDGYRQPAYPTELFTADLGRGLPVPFWGSRQFKLVVIIKYRIVKESGFRGPWATRIGKYEYSVLDKDDREILAFHWHPGQRNTVSWPHLHMGNAILVGTYGFLHKAHIRTERIALEDVVRLAIEEFGISPVPQHVDNWDRTLDQRRKEFERLRTWP